MRTGVEPVLEDVEMGTGETPILRVEGGDSFFEDYPGDTLRRWWKSTLRKYHKHPLSLFLLFPQRKPLPVLHQGGRGSRPWQGGWIYHGSESS